MRWPLSKTLPVLSALLSITAGCWERVSSEPSAESAVKVRAIYGGLPGEKVEGSRLKDFGINAVFIGSGSVNDRRVKWVKEQGAYIFAEFNTLHKAEYLERVPDAAPVGADGKVCPPPHGWQGVCPTHPGYRNERMQSFRTLLQTYSLDGIWLDYHHSHASWERDVPEMPDTCFCDRCLRLFSLDSSIPLPERPEEAARLLLDEYEATWSQWRCDLLTDWVREFREIVEEERPSALLGTFHNPWSDEAFDGARIKKLAIDLKAQAAYIDVFSPMPYHARFGHAEDLEWIAERVAWLGNYLGIEGKHGEEVQIWPIVQLSDWGEEVQAAQVEPIIRFGSRSPATGIIVFAWGSLRKQPEKVSELRRVLHSMANIY